MFSDVNLIAYGTEMRFDELTQFLKWYEMVCSHLQSSIVCKRFLTHFTFHRYLRVQKKYSSETRMGNKKTSREWPTYMFETHMRLQIVDCCRLELANVAFCLDLIVVRFLMHTQRSSINAAPSTVITFVQFRLI